MKLFRRLRQRFGQQGQRLDKDRDFAGIRALKRAIHADQVAQVKRFDQLPLLLRDVGLGDHQLNAAGPVLDVIELELSLVVAEHHPAGDADRGAGDSRLGGHILAGRRDGDVTVEALPQGSRPSASTASSFFSRSNSKRSGLCGS